MIRVLALCAAALLAVETPIGQLSDKDVSRVIGRADKMSRSVCLGDLRPGQFNVCVQGPEQRIASAANAAKLTGKSLKANTVPNEMKSLTWTVFALPNAPALVAGKFVRTPSAQTIRLRLTGAADASSVDPLNATLSTYSWDNSVGARLISLGITAVFDAWMLDPGTIDILITTENGAELHYALPQDARDRIR
jgi:hypothetical protein